ncbi:hypothetical protein ACUL41_04785 [Virgibacillus natechei]
MKKKKWEAYTNISQDNALQIFKTVFRDQKLEYTITKGSPIYMYDSKNEQVLIKINNDCVISLIYVSADPLTRFFSNVLGTLKNFNGITLLSITYSNHSKDELAQVLKGFVYHSQKPWKITRYPRFRFAILLQLITKSKWKRFLSV